MRDHVDQRRLREPRGNRGATCAKRGLIGQSCAIGILAAGIRDCGGDAQDAGRGDVRRRGAADKRDHRHAHIEGLDRAVDAAEGHRVEHEIDEPVTRGFRHRRDLGRNTMRSRDPGRLRQPG